MGASDFKITSDARRILTKYWINLKILRFSCIGGIVYLRGSLDIMYNASSTGDSGGGITAERVRNLERALKKIPNVKRVKFQLTNWEKQADGWTKKTSS
jgi:hypothetical protein